MRVRSFLLLQVLDRLSRRKKQLLALVADCVAIPALLWVAIALRLGEWRPDVLGFWPAFLASLVVAIPLFVRTGLYRQIIRYIGSEAIRVIVRGVSVTALAVAAVAYMIPMPGFPRSVPVIFWLLVVLYVTGSRFLVRSYLHGKIKLQQGGGIPILIYGAGNKGADLARLLRLHESYEVKGFIDTDPMVQGSLIDGFGVYSPEQLSQLLTATQAKEIFVAVSNAAPDEMRYAFELLAPFSVRVRLIPDMESLLSGRQSLLSIRDVNAEDILGRSAVPPVKFLLEGSVRAKCVLVTGAAGSIGSELCRQILAMKPSTLIMLDHYEHGLFQLTRDLEACNSETELLPLLGSVLDKSLVSALLRRQPISTIYHAAAYKHVSLVEANAVQGIMNNTLGTLNLAQAAADSCVERFILVSTDKAVRTVNMMGASKRLAEMVLQALQETAAKTCFGIVRFGNVIGSSGSVVPLFEEQIKSGGPVTVTHPDATRYFMTIPEAVQLILQAGSLMKGGDIFVLDMGEPVRILDLARKLIRLHGYRVKEDSSDGDIAIVFTGLKAGEKLHESLFSAGAEVTEHPKIFRAHENFIRWEKLSQELAQLQRLCAEFNVEGVKDSMESLIEDAKLFAEIGRLNGWHEMESAPLEAK